MQDHSADYKKRSHIISESFQLFRRYGIKNISMSDISQQMGISKKTIYKYFQNKEDLLINCVEKGTDIFDVAVNHIINSEKNPVIKITEIFHVALKELVGYSLPYLYELSKYPDTRQKIQEYQQVIIFTHVHSLYQQAKEKKLIREDVDIDLVCTLHSFFLEEFTYGRKSRELRKDFERIYKHLILFNIKGFLSEKHAHLLDDKIA